MSRSHSATISSSERSFRSMTQKSVEDEGTIKNNPRSKKTTRGRGGRGGPPLLVPPGFTAE